MGVEAANPGPAPATTAKRLPLLTRWATAWRTFLPRRFRLSHWSWLLTIVVALIYVACFARFISRHTSLPVWDGYVYVSKTWTLAENLHNASSLQRLNPTLYLSRPQPERPPLLIAIAAIALGPNATPASIAYVWLTVRVVVILLALYLLSREFGTARFLPAAAFVIFASPLMCNFYRLYFMDEPFAAFGLLAFALLLIDDRRQTMLSAFAASLSILALFLIKPVAPAFVFPFCIIRATRALLPLRHDWPNLRPHIQPLLAWALPYLLLAAAMVWLLNATPYGPGIREQFKLGLTGFWHQDLTAREALRLISFLFPPWLLLTFLVVLPFSSGFQHKAVLLYLTGGLFWWLLFSFFLTYAIDDRLLGQAMPYVVTAVLLWICQRPAITAVVTVLAASFFLCSTLLANGRISPLSTPKVARFLSPMPDPQQPVPEVGLLPFAKQLVSAVKERPRVIYTVFGDNYVDATSLKAALRSTVQTKPIAVQALPKAPQEFNLAQFFQKRWFMTKTKRPNTGYAHTGLWTTVNCVHALITDLDSPLHEYFRKVLEAPIHQPDLEDTLVLWYLPATPPDAVLAESLRWLKPRLTNDPPAFSAAIDSQLKALAIDP
jgi:hypothetical protein